MTSVVFIVLAVVWGIAILAAPFVVWPMRSRVTRLENEIAVLRATVLRDRAAGPCVYSADTIPANQDQTDVKSEEDETVAVPIEDQNRYPVSETSDAPVYADMAAARSYDHSYDPENILRRDGYEEAENSSALLDRPKRPEFNFAARLPVWIGGVSLICAAFFLVRYSIENGLLGPAARLSLGALFGIALTIDGIIISRQPHISNARRIAQALSGAGLVALYFTFYAAVVLYHMLSPMAGFAGMSAVTVAAVALALQIGQPIAVFALIGGLATPALIGADDPNSWMLFSYLFAMTAGMFFVFMRKGWTLLSLVSICGFFLWAGFFQMFFAQAADKLPLLLFAAAMALTALFSQNRRDADGRDLRVPDRGTALSAAVGMIFLTQNLAQATFLDWGIYSVLSLASMALAWRQGGSYRYFTFALLAAGMVFFTVYAPSASVIDRTIILSVMAAIYVVLPQALFRKNAVDFRAALQSLASIGFFGLAYFYARPIPDGEHIYWAAFALILTAAGVWQTASTKLPGQNDSGHADAAAIYALGSTAFLSAGLAIVLPEPFLPIAFAAEIFAAVWIARATRFDFLKTIAMILLAGFAVFMFPVAVQILRLLDQSYPILNGPVPVMDFLFSYRLLLSSVLIGAAFAVSHERASGLRKTLFALSIGLLTAAVYTALRVYFETGVSVTHLREMNFIHRGLLTMSFAIIGLGACYLARRMKDKFYFLPGLILIHFALARIVLLDVLLGNPYFDSALSVGPVALFNGLIIYPAGAALAFMTGYGLRRYGRDFYTLPQAGYNMLSFGLSFVFITLSVRHAFHGSVLAGGGMSNAELYTYSVVWLACGLGLLAAGIRRDSYTLRLAATAILALVIGKVFLVDAAALEGLFRIFSFLGLGLCLIGLSSFYTRFVARKAADV